MYLYQSSRYKSTLQIPSHLIEFLRPSKPYVSPSSYIPTDPQLLTPEIIQEELKNRFRKALITQKIENSPWLEQSYPSPTVFWPNPLIHNHRIKPFFLPIPKSKNSENETLSNSTSSTLEKDLQTSSCDPSNTLDLNIETKKAQKIMFDLNNKDNNNKRNIDLYDREQNYNDAELNSNNEKLSESPFNKQERIDNIDNNSIEVDKSKLDLSAANFNSRENEQIIKNQNLEISKVQIDETQDSKKDSNYGILTYIEQNNNNFKITEENSDYSKNTEQISNISLNIDKSPLDIMNFNLSNTDSNFSKSATDNKIENDFKTNLDNVEKNTSISNDNPYESDEIYEKNKIQILENRERLESLWNYSSSHGISWDKLDQYFFDFLEEKRTHEEKWKAHEDELMKFVSEKARLIVRKKRIKIFEQQNDDLNNISEENKENLLQPRSLVKKITRRLYFKYKSQYLNPWSEGKLIIYLKGKATFHMLNREDAERYYNSEIGDNLLNDEISINQNHKVEEINSTAFDIWDMEGVGQTRIKRLLERLNEKKKEI